MILQYHDPEDEPAADPIPESFFDFDKHKDQLSKEQLKGMRFRFCTLSIEIANTIIFDRINLRGDHATYIIIPYCNYYQILFI